MRLIATLGLAATLQFLPALAQAGGDPVAGQQKSAPCAACHGADGNSASPAFPSLAGQHQTYLAAALEQYRSGDRKNPIMSGQAVNLSDADIADLAAYYARQKGSLYTPGYSNK